MLPDSWNMEPVGTGWKPRLGKPRWKPKWGLLYSQLYAPYSQTSFNYLIISNSDHLSCCALALSDAGDE